MAIGWIGWWVGWMTVAQSIKQSASAGPSKNSAADLAAAVKAMAQRAFESTQAEARASSQQARESTLYGSNGVPSKTSSIGSGINISA